MNLHRDRPPAGDPLEISEGVWVFNGPPRTVEGATPADVRKALEASAAAVWGHDRWRQYLEIVFDLRKGAIKEWNRRDQIPPPMILGWVGYLNSWPDKRSIGMHLVGFGLGDTLGPATTIWKAI